MRALIRKFTPSFLINWYHFSLALLGAVFYFFPSRRLKVIGVTGTNGKSTVVELISGILEEEGYRVAFASSIKFKIDDKEWKNTLKMTMPGRLKIQKFLRQAVKNKCRYAVLEITSEGMKQHRHRFINFEAAVLTNLAPEHIESHGSFEKYRDAKGLLFKATKRAHIINLDDKNADYFLKFPAEEKYIYGINRESTDRNYKFIKATDVKIQDKGISFVAGDVPFNMKLLGGFNVYNALAAICAGLSQDIDLKTCKLSLEKVEGIPGRMEQIISRPFKVFVDYAFTPNALEKVYQTLKPEKSRMICVLGACGGGRDKWKRPVLGEIAAKYCQEIIITNEDPYDENPAEIIEQVAKGTSGKAKKILDRREAIYQALKSAKEGDVVVITGKGCEPWICERGGKKIPWDDRRVVTQLLTKIMNML